MKWQKYRREDPEINLISLIDVLVILLIFFMLSSSFERVTQIKIELPHAQAQPQQEQGQPIEVVIDAEGHYYVGDHRLVNTQIGTLMEAVRRALAGRKNPPFVIRADGRTPHQAVVTAMDAARRLGITHLAIATTNGDAGGGR
jgi:biopolymer transport protein ExbD